MRRRAAASRARREAPSADGRRRAVPLVVSVPGLLSPSPREGREPGRIGLTSSHPVSREEASSSGTSGGGWAPWVSWSSLGSPGGPGLFSSPPPVKFRTQPMSDFSQPGCMNRQASAGDRARVRPARRTEHGPHAASVAPGCLGSWAALPPSPRGERTRKNRAHSEPSRVQRRSLEIGQERRRVGPLGLLELPREPRRSWALLLPPSCEIPDTANVRLFPARIYEPAGVCWGQGERAAGEAHRTRTDTDQPPQRGTLNDVQT